MAIQRQVIADEVVQIEWHQLGGGQAGIVPELIDQRFECLHWVTMVSTRTVQQLLARRVELAFEFELQALSR